MAKKLWGGRFSKKTDPLVEEFTQSIKYDYVLAKDDVQGSMSHVEILKNGGFLSSEEADRLQQALGKIYAQLENNSFTFDNKCEDIHTNIQNAVEEEVGDLALKLHTARSRNDQILFDLKVFCKIELYKISTLCLKFSVSLSEASKSKNVAGIIMPGFTHLQHAQLVYLSDYLVAYEQMVHRDSERIMSLAEGIEISLGAGALAGTPIKPDIYKKAVQQYLDELEKRMDIKKGELNLGGSVSTSKAIDTVSDRDFVIETLSALSILGMHLSRLAEDLIIWSTREFSFVELDDAFTTGSSLMPQKKNPDVLELIRGYTGTLYGNLMSVLTMMKGLPLTYNRDMQLDKPPLFNSLEIVKKELKVLPKLIETLKWNKKAIDDKIDDDETLYATDFVYKLIKKGIAFKDAHDTIGKLVKESLETGRKIRDMKNKELKNFDLTEKDVKEVMDPETSVKSRISVDRKEKN